MEQKEKNKNKASEIDPLSVKKNNNKVLFWILGGCLALMIVTGLIAAGFAYWGYKKINQAASENKRQMEKRQQELNRTEEKLQNFDQPTRPLAQEPPQTILEDPATGDVNNQSSEGMQPFSGEKQIGYIKNVYAKNGKKFLDVDYIQWLSGTEAQKAMRADGECPKTGECVVLNDYYIRNVNPLIRTFEISADAEMTMQTYTMETTGQIQPEKISFTEFSRIWNTNTRPSLRNVPYIVEISSNQIMKINEQYVP